MLKSKQYLLVYSGFSLFSIDDAIVSVENLNIELYNMNETEKAGNIQIRRSKTLLRTRNLSFFYLHKGKQRRYTKLFPVVFIIQYFDANWRCRVRI